MATTGELVAHVWRRLGFGPRPGGIERWEAAGPRALAERLCERRSTTEWNWPEGSLLALEVPLLDRLLELMADNSDQLFERVTWFLQNVLVLAASSNPHVRMHHHRAHLDLLRTWPNRSYVELLGAVAASDGMQRYLTNIESAPPHPNQNLARELLELFSLGVRHPIRGADNYTQADVTEIARALTGWEEVPHEPGRIRFNSARWDSGAKEFLGKPRGQAGFGRVMRALADHDAFGHYLSGRLYRELVGFDPDHGARAELRAAWGDTGDVLGTIKTIVARPEFLSDAALNARIKSPLERVVSAIRVLELRDLPRFELLGHLTEMAQSPFRAPNVAGWPDGPAWLQPGTFVAWSQCAHVLAFADSGTDLVPAERQSRTLRRMVEEGSSVTGGALALHYAGIRNPTPATVRAVAHFAEAGTWNMARAAGTMYLAFLSPEFLSN